MQQQQNGVNNNVVDMCFVFLFFIFCGHASVQLPTQQWEHAPKLVGGKFIECTHPATAAAMIIIKNQKISYTSM